MSRGKKAIGIILSLILLTILIPVVVSNSPYTTLPFDWYRRDFINYQPTNYIWQQYLFWVALVISILLLIFILVLVFYPKAKQSFVLSEDGGKMSIDPKAIEGLVRSHLNEKEFVSSPKVKVIATKNKIKINVKGQLKRTSSLIGRTNELMANIQQEVQHTLGSQEKVKVHMTYTNFENEKNSSTQKPRVV